jgi:hypothetical protein
MGITMQKRENFIHLSTKMENYIAKALFAKDKENGYEQQIRT